MLCLAACARLFPTLYHSSPLLSLISLWPVLLCHAVLLRQRSLLFLPNSLYFSSRPCSSRPIIFFSLSLITTFRPTSASSLFPFAVTSVAASPDTLASSSCGTRFWQGPRSNFNQRQRRTELVSVGSIKRKESGCDPLKVHDGRFQSNKSSRRADTNWTCISSS